MNVVSSSSDGGAFFPGNGNGSATGSPNSPSGNGNNGGLPPNNANHVQNLANQTELQQTPVMPTYQVNTVTTLCKLYSFSTNQILREINFGYSGGAKSAVFSIFEALNFVNLVNYSLQKVQKSMKIKIQSL